MSFYTALTGLNGSQADIAATSNNIANVGTTGFKRSRAEFGDIFATSPLQNSSSSIGSGSILKGVKQQFTQGNIAASLNALDLAISGQGFFALKPSLTSSQVVYTRNGSFNVDNNRNVVDSTGQFLLTYPVNEDGSVTSKTINDAVPLQLPVTSGEPKATSNIDLAINLPADAPVITDNPKFADGYQFSSSDPESFTNSTSLTIFDDLGNPTIATVYFIKTQAATADDPTNKYATRLVIDDVVINPDLVAAVNDNGDQLYVDRFGKEMSLTDIPDETYFSDQKGSPLYRKDDLNQRIPSQPAKLTGIKSSFDFGEEGDKTIQITNDPMMFKATEEGGNTDSGIFWGNDFLLVNVDDGDVPVSIDLRAGFYNATQLAAEVERAINDAYGDDNKLRVNSNVDDTLTIDFSTLNQNDGALKPLGTPITVDLLDESFVSEQRSINVSGAAPMFTREEFLAHAQVRINESMNDYVVTQGRELGVGNQLFTRSGGEQMDGVLEATELVSFEYNKVIKGDATQTERHLVHSYYNKEPTLSVYDNKTSVNNEIVYDPDADKMFVSLDPSLSAADITEMFSEGEVIRIAASFGDEAMDANLNGRPMTILSVDTATKKIALNTSGEGFGDSPFTLRAGEGKDFTEAYVMSDISADVEAFFEGEDLSPEGAVNSYNNKRIVLRETQDAKHSHGHNDAGLSAINASGAASNVEYYAFTDVTDSAIPANEYTAGEIISAAASANLGLTSTGRVVPVVSQTSSKALNELEAGKVYQNVTGGTITLAHSDDDNAEIVLADGASFRYDPALHTYAGTVTTDYIYSAAPNAVPTTTDGTNALTLAVSSTVQPEAETRYYAETDIISATDGPRAGEIFTATSDPIGDYLTGADVVPVLTTDSLSDGFFYKNLGSTALNLTSSVTVAPGETFVYSETTHTSLQDDGQVAEISAPGPGYTSNTLAGTDVYISSTPDVYYVDDSSDTADANFDGTIYNGSGSAVAYYDTSYTVAADADFNGTIYNNSGSDVGVYADSDAAVSDVANLAALQALDFVYNSTNDTIILRAADNTADPAVTQVTIASGAVAAVPAGADQTTMTGLKPATTLADGGFAAHGANAVVSAYTDVVEADSIPAGDFKTLGTGHAISDYTGVEKATALANNSFHTLGTDHVFSVDDNQIIPLGFTYQLDAEEMEAGVTYFAINDITSAEYGAGEVFTTGQGTQSGSASGTLVKVVDGSALTEGVTYKYVGSSPLVYRAAAASDSNSLETNDIFEYDASTHSDIQSGDFIRVNVGADAVQTEQIAVNAEMKLVELKESFVGLTSEGLHTPKTGTKTSLELLGLGEDVFTNETVWVDEKNPPIKIDYDAVNQRFQFSVNHTAIGPGTDSNFRAFKIYGAEDADGTNNLGIPSGNTAETTTISSTAIITGEPFVADGSEMQINAKRFGAEVQYNSDTASFTFKSGTTGEDISRNGALGVDEQQKASNIAVGRYRIDRLTGEPVNTNFDTALKHLGTGDNGLMGVGQNASGILFEEARGLASEPARAIGAAATEPLNEIFSLSTTGGTNSFNVSVNGISGIVTVPAGNYVGSTLAAELQTRINQMSDPVTGAVVGGVTVQYSAETNNFTFTTGTTGDQATIKVKGSSKLGLDDVPLGVGSVPTILNLVQAVDENGSKLYVNASGEITTTPPAKLVTDYYPLYIDEGELTFDKTGQIISPLNKVRYEQQASGFSISLDVDYSASTQLSQPFAVNNLEQDGFTSGRLDGLDIDATGLLRANYTNGENRPLGKIVLANFNNQNGLKQIGNATFVETATSGTPTFGEAGAEGFGSIQSGSLERSNVDITEELVNLITAQRNFQASSKAIETSTQLTQAIINIRS